MRRKVLIPNRGIIALDIINSLNSVGLETILLHSPEDSLSLPVKLADRSYKFLSSKLEDSYLDMDAIIEKALELKVDYIHPGYGFLAEKAQFARQCREQGIHFIGPSEDILSLTADKLELRRRAESLGIRVMTASELITSPLDFEDQKQFRYPLIFKPLRGSGGAGIRFARNHSEAKEKVHLMLRSEKNQQEGIFFEEFFGDAHHIEIPFFRDAGGNILFLPEIESSIQRRFQKLLQESPSVNVTSSIRDSLYHDSQKLISSLGYIGLGYIEFFLNQGKTYFSEINPTFQINSLIPELHLTQNIIKKQFPISLGEPIHHVSGVKVAAPKHHVMLVSLMAENPFDNFQPSSGIIRDFFHYSTIRNIFKTTLYTGARVSQLYDPFIAKILTYAFERPTVLNDMRIFLDNITIVGIRTNLIFLKHLLETDPLHRGETPIDFLQLHFDFAKRKKSEEEIHLAAALMAADFHIDNRKKNLKQKLEKMKQPGFFKRLFGGI